jgi:hypothetical protein
VPHSCELCHLGNVHSGVQAVISNVLNACKLCVCAQQADLCSARVTGGGVVLDAAAVTAAVACLSLQLTELQRLPHSLLPCSATVAPAAGSIHHLAALVGCSVSSRVSARIYRRSGAPMTALYAWFSVSMLGAQFCTQCMLPKVRARTGASLTASHSSLCSTTGDLVVVVLKPGYSTAAGTSTQRLTWRRRQQRRACCSISMPWRCSS